MKWIVSNSELYHFGIKGQKWGVRRFENENGELTAAGKARYNEVDGKYQKLKGPSRSQQRKTYRLMKKEELEDRIYGSSSNKSAKKIIKENNSVSEKYEKYKQAKRKAEEYYNSKVSEFDRSGRSLKDKEYKRLDQEQKKSYEELKSEVSSILGKYGDKPIKDSWGNKTTASEKLLNNINMQMRLDEQEEYRKRLKNK